MLTAHCLLVLRYILGISSEQMFLVHKNIDNKLLI